MYSSIQKKHCKCSEGCTYYPSIGYAGYHISHAPEELFNKQFARKKKHQANLRLKTKIRKLENKVNPLTISLNMWYADRRKEMDNVCCEFGCPNLTNKHSDRYYRWSVCHIVPKGLILSVATHPLNWIELCQDHHHEFDSSFETASKMKCFSEAKRKFELFKNFIAIDERRKVNPYLYE